MNKLKITLIKPNIGRREHGLYVDEARMEPLQLGVLAAMTPADIEVVLYDDRMEMVPYDEQTDLAAITVETFTARRAYEISAEYAARGVPVIMGGMHAKRAFALELFTAMIPLKKRWFGLVTS
ncbi:MAG: hypothetical protein PHR37_04980 [Eubacteriales bacterium]|nr:hypothetical protein [Eubacteriales bacterium]